MPTAFDQQDLDETMAQITAKLTAETEQRSILSKALDIIATLTGTKRLAKAEATVPGTEPCPSPAATAPGEAPDHEVEEATTGAEDAWNDGDVSKSEGSHIHVHMHNGGDDGEEEDRETEGMTMDEDRKDDAAMADAIVNDILEIFEHHYARHDTGGAAMEKSTQAKPQQDLTPAMVKDFLTKALQAPPTHDDRLATLEKSQAELLHEMKVSARLRDKQSEALDTLGKAMLQLSTTQETISKSLTKLAEAQEVHDSQPRPSRYEAVRQAAPVVPVSRTAQGFDKKRAVDALAKGLITVQSQEYRDWKYRGIVPEAVHHPLG